MIKFFAFCGFVRGTTDMEKLLTIREVAERLSIAEGTAYHWLCEGRLPCVRFSKRCVRFRESDVQKMIEELVKLDGARPIFGKS